MLGHRSTLSSRWYSRSAAYQSFCDEIRYPALVLHIAFHLRLSSRLTPTRNSSNRPTVFAKLSTRLEHYNKKIKAFFSFT